MGLFLSVISGNHDRVIFHSLEGTMVSKKKGNNSVTIYPDWCKGCGICVEFCPGKVLELNDLGKSSVVHEENCIGCGFCELHCPDFAIVVREKKSVEADRCGCEPEPKATKKATGKGA